MEENVFKSRVDLNALNESIKKIREEIGKVIVGQEQMIDLLITAILADGHVLIEGVPGVAKTLTAKLISKVISVNFSRIQFTPDLMPSDVLGTSVFNMNKLWKLRPTMQFKFTEDAPFSFDVSAAAIYNDKLFIGGMYRLDAAAGAFVQYQVTPQFKAGFATDFGTQKLRTVNDGTFEIMLSYDFYFNTPGIRSPRYF